jgi:hypothetical protein
MSPFGCPPASSRSREVFLLKAVLRARIVPWVPHFGRWDYLCAFSCVLGGFEEATETPACPRRIDVILYAVDLRSMRSMLSYLRSVIRVNIDRGKSP